MPKTVKHKFEIEHLQILDEDGNVDEKLEPKIADEDLKKIYETMVVSRVFDQKAVKMQRQGKLATFAPSTGEEAAMVASTFALRKQDWMVPSYRESPCFITRGVPLEAIYIYMKGSEEGSRGEPDAHNMPVSVPVGSQPLHAVGLGYAAKLRKKDEAALVFFGDGATSEGETLEAMNFSGAWKTPTIFLCRNNGWAISVPTTKQTAAESFAQKAIAFGIKGIQVDGNDVLAVYAATKEAIERGSKGKGATLIEAITYRMGMHTTADDPKKYRKEEEVEPWKEKDPIERFEKYLRKKKLLDDNYKEKVWAEAEEKVAAAAKKSEEFKAGHISEIFKYTFAEMPYIIKEQMDYAQKTWEEENNG